MLNSRPLTHVADYHDNVEPLTPNHFLLHRPYANLTPGVFQDSSYQLTHKSWKETQKLVNSFSKRLLTEYIPTLHHRSKWNQQLPPITVKKRVVWVLRDFTPRGILPIGRVEAVFPGRDGQTRVCSVKTAYGTFERPAVSLSRVFAPVRPRLPSLLPAAWLNINSKLFSTLLPDFSRLFSYFCSNC